MFVLVASHLSALGSAVRATFHSSVDTATPVDDNKSIGVSDRGELADRISGPDLDGERGVADNAGAFLE